MRFTLFTGPVFLLVASGAGTGAAALQDSMLAPPATSSRQADFKIVIWYRHDRPLDTFRYQIYDLRKGQYTKAVDDWLTVMHTRFPAYDAVMRDVDLGREKGETESLKVGSIIRQELLAAAALEGVFIGGAAGGQPLSRIPRIGLPPRPELMGRPSLLGPRAAPPIDLNPPQPSFPVPVPYPRPHP
jgi:hypothetical protein